MNELDDMRNLVIWGEADLDELLSLAEELLEKKELNQ